MFNADCHVGVVYLIMCKPTTYTACYVVCSVFFVCTVGLCVYNLLITYDDDDDETEKPTSATPKTCEWGQYWIRQTSNLALNIVRPTRKFRIGTSLSNRIRIGTSDSNSNRISKLRRSLLLSKSDSTEVRPMLHTGMESGPWYSSTLWLGPQTLRSIDATDDDSILMAWNCWWRCHRKYLTTLLAMRVVLSAVSTWGRRSNYWVSLPQLTCRSHVVSRFASCRRRRKIIHHNNEITMSG